jgi:hypothetical protein
MTGTERSAASQNVFREVNECVVEVHRAMAFEDGPDQLLEVFCECGGSHCAERLELTRAEYERVRGDGARFVLALGHETTLVERVVERSDRYLVVENDGRAAELSREADPRSEPA